PGLLGVLATATSAVLATVAAHWAQATAAGAALVLLLVWIVLYTQVSAPINRQLTAAADASQPLPNGRVLQAKWDRIIGAPAMLQGRPLPTLCGALTICRAAPTDPPQPISTEAAQRSMFQLRIYTLRSPEALQQYATVHWARHLATFKIFGVTTH